MDAPIVESPATVQSLAELRERHLALLRAWTPSPADGLPADPSAEAAPAGASPRVREAEALREAAAALGAWLDDPEERDRAQGMIDYWTAALGALPDYAFPQMLTLAPFDPALPAAVVARAEELLAEHAGTAREADADALLLRLVRPGPGDTIVCQPPLDRAFLEHADGVTDMTASQDELIDSLVAAGVIRKIPGESAELDKFDFTHGSVARACPRLRGLLDKRRNVNETRDKLRATAQLWKDSNHDRGYLLTGTVLDDAVQYQRDDKLLEEFIRASRDAEERGKTFRLKLWTAGTTILVILIFAIIGAWIVGKGTGFLAGTEIGATIESEAPTARADTAVAVPRGFTAEQPPQRPRGAPGIDGWIWIGDDSMRLLRWLESGQAVDPTRITPGTFYRTRTRIRLRRAAPDEDNVPGPDMGLMSPDALVVAGGPPVRIDRASGAQFWLPVTLVPRLRIQFARPEDQVDSDALARRMRAAGFDVEPPSLNAGARGLGLLNYFRKDESALAADTTRRLAGAMRQTNGAPAVLGCELTSNPTIGTGVLDLTLDFGTLTVRGEPRRGAPPPEPAPEVECR